MLFGCKDQKYLRPIFAYQKMSEEGIDVKFEKQLKTQQVLDIINKLMKQS